MAQLEWNPRSDRFEQHRTFETFVSYALPTISIAAVHVPPIVENSLPNLAGFAKIVGGTPAINVG